jgi:hypothetical protein
MCQHTPCTCKDGQPIDGVDMYMKVEASTIASLSMELTAENLAYLRSAIRLSLHNGETGTERPVHTRTIVLILCFGTLSIHGLKIGNIMDKCTIHVSMNPCVFRIICDVALGIYIGLHIYIYIYILYTMWHAYDVCVYTTLQYETSQVVCTCG